MSQSGELVVIIRPSFMKFCQDGCRAALFNHILYWISQKAKGESEEKIKRGEVYWYATNEELTAQMTGAWSYNKIRQEVQALVNTGLIGVTHNPHWGADRTKFFYFGPEHAQKLRLLCEEQCIDLAQIGLSMDVLHLLNLVIAITKFSKCNYQKEQMHLPDLVNGITKSGRAITKNTTKITTKDNNKEREAATDTALPSEGSLSSSTSFSSDESSSEKKESSLPTMPPSEAPWNKETCLGIFDARRGKLITDQKRLRAAHECASNLVTNYTRQQVEQVAVQMNADPYWIGRGSADIEQVARNIDRELNKLKQKQGSASMPTSSSSSPSPTPVNSTALLEKLRKQQQAATAQKGLQYATQ